MKRNMILLFAAVMLGNLSCRENTDSSVGGEGIVAFNEFSGQFAEPSREYGAAPLWVWNTRVTHELIDASMKELKEQGFGGVFVHPRPGLITEYLSDEWFELWRYAMEAGKKLDMDVWIYDENSYPSGFAGGHVPAEMPESYNQGKSLLAEKYEVFPDSVPDAFLCYRKEHGTFREITSGMKDEPGRKGEYYVLRKGYDGRSPWFGGYSYVDLLYPGVTEKFIEITMDGYKQALGDEFGKAVPGWFTDEPNISPPGGIRWTPDLFDVFQARWGYDLKACLPSLLEETGDWKKVRHNYTQTLLQLFIDRWAKPCYEYCEANSLKLTGHYWEHGWPNVADGGDNMAMYAWHQQPAIDMLFNQYDDVSPQAQFGNVRAVKELSSVANQTGARRTLSETYGGGGWEETFRDFKRLGDWEYALGVNFMNQHLAHLSIAGARKYDYPPTFSEHSPWWPYYRDLNVYFARLSMALSAGEQVNDLLILEPTTSVWLYYAYGYSNPAYMEIGKTFQQFVTALEKAQVEYDLGSENIIRDRGSVAGKKFVIGRRAYSKVVIPPMTENLDAATFALLRKFAENGGTILSYAQPAYVDGAPNDDLRAFFSGSAAGVTLLTASASPDLTPYAQDDVRFRAASGTDLYHHRRIMKDGQVLFLSNASLTETARGSIRLKGADAIEANAMTGQIVDYPETGSEGGRIELSYDLPPAGSLLLYVFNRKKPHGYALPERADRYAETPSATPVSVSPETDNVLTVDFCDLTLGKEQYRDLHVYDAADRAFKYHGFSSGNPWNTSVQYKNSIVSRDTFTAGGFTASYRFVVSAAFDVSGLQAVVERPGLYEIGINGHTVTPLPGAWWLDRETGVCPVGEYVKQGENVLTLKLPAMKLLAEIEPVYIRGNFRLTPAAKGWEITAPAETFTLGSWKAQGRPFYPGAMLYTKTFNVANPSGRYIVQADDWKGTVAEVSVNGKAAGLIAFDPYTVDVSGLLKEGENTVTVKVIGSNKNLLGPFHNSSAPGLVSPWHFRNVKAWPPGEEYRQLDYGLMKDFALKKAE
ncbi:MAG: hypothetical protein LBK22_03670 [Tannerella sp.]|jgi:hypothetical protein|nr:hypothetical protein [Tannerella sp.]